MRVAVVRHAVESALGYIVFCSSAMAGRTMPCATGIASTSATAAPNAALKPCRRHMRTARRRSRLDRRREGLRIRAGQVGQRNARGRHRIQLAARHHLRAMTSCCGAWDAPWCRA